ncbi:MAG: hypothetical protein IVW55_11290 [Chloroflexi bacterium]|nr:hypothetical protein [Chloroflexota bacterium]
MHSLRAAEMEERAWFARYVAIALAVVGGVEWFLGRTVSRLAAAPPLQGVARTFIEYLGRVGIFLLSPSFVLAASLFLLSVITYGSYASSRGDVVRITLSIYLALFAVIATVHSLFIALQLFPDQVWFNISFNILSLIAVWSLAIYFLSRGDAARAARLSVLFVAVAFAGWYYYVLQQSISDFGLRLPLDPVAARDFGELVAVVAPLLFFAAIALPNGQWRHRKRWIAPLLLVLLFSAANVADMLTDQGFTGVFATWSLGFNLYLPWPLYALALGLFVYALLTAFAGDANNTAFANSNTGLGMMLLVFAGYALQLPYQHLIAVLALLLFSGVAVPFGARSIPLRRSYELAPHNP